MRVPYCTQYALDIKPRSARPSRGDGPDPEGLSAEMGSVDEWCLS